MKWEIEKDIRYKNENNNVEKMKNGESAVGAPPTSLPLTILLNRP